MVTNTLHPYAKFILKFCNSFGKGLDREIPMIVPFEALRTARDIAKATCDDASLGFDFLNCISTLINDELIKIVESDTYELGVIKLTHNARLMLSELS